MSLRLTIAALFALFLAGCTQPPGHNASSVDFPSPGGVEIHKSQVDDREYRYLTLANGLEVLLISDPDADKAAASLSIDVGSFQNPPDREGLAHFLEHMLFLGTEKYPEPGAYQAFISEHGGSHNAYTSLEETNYFFDVDAAHLDSALDRFSQFFVAPLFNARFVDRERHAVESEYQLKIRDDMRREWDVLRELVNPDHPLAKFSVGNLETLANREGDPVREDLLDFYRRYYSADRMNLVVLGRQDLGRLETLVENRFAAVPDRDGVLPKDPEPLFERELPFRVLIEPEKEIRKLSFSFPLPSVKEEWRLKPMAFLGHLIGHEGEGSLLAELKRRGLAEGLVAGMAFDSRAGALFNVSITLTPAGVSSHDAVTRALFDWLALIRKEGIDDWRYEEVAALQRTDFLYAEEQQPAGYVRRLSSLMHDYPPAEVLRGPFLYADFDARRLARFAGYLRLDNALITLTAPGVETDRESELYSAPYAVQPVSPGQLLKGGEVAWRDRLSLPRPNPYIPDSLALHGPEDPPARPVAVPLSGGDTLWHYPTVSFGTPKAVFEGRLVLPGRRSLEQETLLELYMAMVRDSLSSQVYPAALAGLSFDLGRWENGLTVRLQGYSDKQDRLLETVLAAMAEPDWSSEQFQRVKASLGRNWRNVAKEWPISQAFNQLPALVRDDWLPREKAEVLEAITLNRLARFSETLFERGHANFYAAGNLLRGPAVDMAQAVAEHLQLGRRGTDRAIYRVARLVPAEPLPEFYQPVSHTDQAALLYVQGQADNLEERAMFALLQVATEAPFYSSLRTEQQLGYVVGNSLAPMHRVPGMVFYVQSPGTDTGGMKQAVDGFFARYQKAVADLDAATFERYREAVLTRIEEAPKNLGELAERHLASLRLGFEAFDFYPQLADAVRATTLDEFRAAYDRVLMDRRAGLWILASEGVEAGTVGRDRLSRNAGEPFRYLQ